LSAFLSISVARESPEWLSVYEELGEFERIVLWGTSDAKEPSRMVAAIHRAFLAEPGRRGLARILAVWIKSLDKASEGQKMRIPLPLLESLDWLDSPYRETSIELRLAQPELAPAAAVLLAREIAEI